MPFYPNECYICGKKNSIKRCNECNMVSYCSQSHQEDHWPKHKDICKVILTLMKEKGVSHLFEKFCGVNSVIWKEERDRTFKEIQLRLGRTLTQEEREMILFPRACFVCHDTRQDLLKSCKNCTWASFCNDHPSSFLHDKDCANIKYCNRLEMELHCYSDIIMAATESIFSRIRNPKSLKLPTSMNEFLDENIEPGLGIPLEARAFVSDYCSNPLTTLNALLMLKQFSNSKMVIHVTSQVDNLANWELLLHMVPGLQILKVAIFEQKENSSEESVIRPDCSLMKKRLEVKTFSFGYLRFLEDKEISGDERPNIVLSPNISPMESNKTREAWDLVLKIWNSLTCPLVITTETEKSAGFIVASLKGTFWASLICYKGENQFQGLRPKRNWENGGVCRENQWLIVCKGRESKKKLKNGEANSVKKGSAATISELRKRAEHILTSKDKAKPQSTHIKSLGIETNRNFQTRQQSQPSFGIETFESNPGIFTGNVINIPYLAFCCQELLKQNWFVQQENIFVKQRIGFLERVIQCMNQQMEQLRKANQNLEQENQVMRNLGYGFGEILRSMMNENM